MLFTENILKFFLKKKKDTYHVIIIQNKAGEMAKESEKINRKVKVRNNCLLMSPVTTTSKT